MRIARYLEACVLLAITGCGGLPNIGKESPPIDYVSLRTEREGPSDADPPLEGPMIAVARFHASQLYDDVRVVCRDRETSSARQMKYLRWEEPAPEMVRCVLMDALAGTQGFLCVDRFEASQAGTCLLLQGDLEELYVEESASGWRAHISLSLRLVQIAERKADGVHLLKTWTPRATLKTIAFEVPDGKAAAPPAKGESSLPVIAHLIGELRTRLSAEAKEAAANILKSASETAAGK